MIRPATIYTIDGFRPTHHYMSGAPNHTQQTIVLTYHRVGRVA